MAVKVIAGPKDAEEPADRDEPAVRAVRPVVDRPGRGMRDQEVERPAASEAVAQESGRHLQDLEPDRGLGVLIGPVAVLRRTAQTPQEQAIQLDDPAVQIDVVPPDRDVRVVRTVRRDIVIPVDRAQRRPEGGRDPVEIVVGKVPAADDQVDVAETLTRSRTVRGVIDDIAEGEDPYGALPDGRARRGDG